MAGRAASLPSLILAMTDLHVAVSTNTVGYIPCAEYTTSSSQAVRNIFGIMIIYFFNSWQD